MIKRTMSEWRGLVADCESSGQTQEEWCLSQGINLYTYRDRASYLRKIDKEAAQRVASHDWIEITQRVDVVSNESAERAIPIGSLIIEVGPLKITADTAYSETKLAVILRGLVRPC